MPQTSCRSVWRTTWKYVCGTLTLPLCPSALRSPTSARGTRVYRAAAAGGDPKKTRPQLSYANALPVAWKRLVGRSHGSQRSVARKPRNEGFGTTENAGALFGESLNERDADSLALTRYTLSPRQGDRGETQPGNPLEDFIRKESEILPRQSYNCGNRHAPISTSATAAAALVTYVSILLEMVQGGQKGVDTHSAIPRACRPCKYHKRNLSSLVVKQLTTCSSLSLLTLNGY